MQLNICKKGTILLLMIVAVLSSANYASAQDEDFKRHEISVSYGTIPTTDWIDFYSDVLVTGLLGEATDFSSWGTINATYNFRLTKIIALGGTFTYSHNKNGASTEERFRAENTYFTFLPNAKFNWVNKKYFTLYSRAGLGISFRHAKYNSDGSTDNSTLCAFQVSPIGIEVGNAVAGFVEVGIGTSGILQGGIRCRF